MAYPLINLRCPALLGHGLRWYVGALEQAGVRLCSQLGLRGARRGRGPLETGVWLDPRHKVMAIGACRTLSRFHRREICELQLVCSPFLSLGGIVLIIATQGQVRIGLVLRIAGRSFMFFLREEPAFFVYFLHDGHDDFAIS